MWLIRLIFGFLGWASSISRGIIRLAPAQMALVVVATLVSQLARLLAFFLPLKIIILIGSTGVPRYFPRAFLDFDREPLVVWLGAAAVGFYVLHLVAEKLVEINVEASSDRILTQSAKLTLFSDQQEIARRACKRIAESIAGVIFSVVAMALVAIIHPMVAITVAAWVLGISLLVTVAGMAFSAFPAWLEEHAEAFIDGLGSVGFFVVTAAIVMEFIAGRTFNILYVIISLLLSRQLLQYLSRIVRHGISLSGRKLFINTLFLRGHAWPGEGVAQHRSIWNLVTGTPPEGFLPRTLLEATGRSAPGARLERWHQTGIVDIVAFDVATAVVDGRQPDRYFVKLFSAKRKLFAAHEEALLGAVQPGLLPAPAFAGSTRAGEHHCLVYDGFIGEALTQPELLEARFDFLGECWQARLPDELVQRFKRSHRPLGQRLAATPIERMALAASGTDETLRVEEFRGVLGRLVAALERLPFGIQNPDIRTDFLFRQPDGRVIASHWGRWTLEPIGAGWPTEPSELEHLPHWLDKAREKRSELESVSAEVVQLAAVLFELDRTLARQRYRSAVELLPSLLEKLSKIANDVPG